jgi:hypothetical protein
MGMRAPSAAHKVVSGYVLALPFAHVQRVEGRRDNDHCVSFRGAPWLTRRAIAVEHGDAGQILAFKPRECGVWGDDVGVQPRSRAARTPSPTRATSGAPHVTM